MKTTQKKTATKKTTTAKTSKTVDAAQIGNLLFEMVGVKPLVLAGMVEDLITAHGLKTAGASIGKDWKEREVSSAIDASKPAGLLVSACWLIGLSREDASAFLQAADIVSRQRIHQLLTREYGLTEKQKENREKKKNKKKGRVLDLSTLSTTQVIEALELKVGEFNQSEADQIMMLLRETLKAIV